jgi:hypothetical protein
MSIAPNIIIIYIDIQGEEHHCREEQELYDFGGILALNRNNQTIKNAHSNQFER